jgi:hypothetical protein
MNTMSILQTTPTPGGGGPGGGLNFIADLITLVPRFVVGLLLLIVLYAVGANIGGRAKELTRRINLDAAVMESPLGALFQGEVAVGNLIQSLVKYLFLLTGILVVVSILDLARLTRYGDAVLTYFPSVIGGILIVLTGFVIAGYTGRNIKQSEVVGASGFAPLVAELAKGIIYFISVTLGLEAFGFSTAILNTLAQAVAIGVGLGIAIAIGVAFGLGSQDYVAEQISQWVEGDTDEKEM